MVIADHGPSGEMGRYAHDEVNVAHKGDNLGWPDIYGCEQKPGMLPPPLITWATHALPPGGAVVLPGNRHSPSFAANVLVASLAAEHIHRIVLENGKVAAHEVYFPAEVRPAAREYRHGRPSGELWVSTSNCDGPRGGAAPRRIAILRIVRQ